MVEKFFLQFRLSDEKKLPSLASTKENILMFAPYQNILMRVFHPKSDVTRMYINWQTGAGKTIGTLSVAYNFVLHSIRRFSPRAKVNIMSFNESVFINDLSRWDYFGIVTPEEMKIIREENDREGPLTSEILVKKRIQLTNKANGDYNFLGYKALFGRLFKDIATGETVKVDTYEQLLRDIEDVKIKVDADTLAIFDNSFLICDEIHNVYNSLEANSWGIALQYVLDHTNVRAIFSSATPISNSPTEIVHLLNLLSTKETDRFSKDDLFDENDVPLPDAYEKIRKATVGKISYYKTMSSSDFPSFEYVGESLVDGTDLKFIRCEMSSEYSKIMKSFDDDATINDDNDDDTDTGVGDTRIGFLNDLILPTNDGFIHTSNAVKQKESKYFNFDTKTMTFEITPEYSLEKYAPKYEAMKRIVLEKIKNREGKVIIYHNFVKMTGVLFIEQILKEIGLVPMGQTSKPNSICVSCGRLKKEHSGKTRHITDRKSVV